MIKEREYHEDEKTVLLDHQGQVPAQGPLTDFAEPPRFEQLEGKTARSWRRATCCARWSTRRW